MPQTVIVPKYVNPPKGNARSATVRDQAGGYWGIHPGDMQKFPLGVPVTVDYTQRTDQNGKTWYNITGIIGQQPQAPVVQIQQPQYNVQQRAQQQTPQRQPQANPQAVDEAKKAENIFVCGVVNHAIAHQSYPLDAASLHQLINNARSAWRNELSAEIDEPPFPGSPDDYGDVNHSG